MQSFSRLFRKLPILSPFRTAPPSPLPPLPPPLEPQDATPHSLQAERLDSKEAAEKVPLTEKDVEKCNEKDREQDSRKTIMIAVLLDGDGDHVRTLLSLSTTIRRPLSRLHFPSTYTSKGAEGGRRAALELHNGIERFVRQRFNQSNVVSRTSSQKSVRITLQSFMNGEGAGLYSSKQDQSRSFVQGFNSSLLAFTIADVGTEKEAADGVMEAQLDYLFGDVDLVIVGRCHDDGYAPQLRELNSRCPGKIVLLLSKNRCAPSIKQLGLEDVHFESLCSANRPTRPAPDPTLPALPAPPRHSLPFSNPSLSVPLHFIPLLRTIAATRLERPLCFLVAGELAKQVGWMDWSGYRDEAERLGLVKVGVDKTTGSEYIEIVPLYKSEFAVSTLTSTQAFDRSIAIGVASSIPAQFLPLLRSIRTHKSWKPTCNDIAEQLRVQGHFPPEGWRQHIDAAQRLGLVTKDTTVYKRVVDKISINPGVTLPTTLSFVVHRPLPRSVYDSAAVDEDFATASTSTNIAPSELQ